MDRKLSWLRFELKYRSRMNTVKPQPCPRTILIYGWIDGLMNTRFRVCFGQPARTRLKQTVIDPLPDNNCLWAPSSQFPCRRFPILRSFSRMLLRKSGRRTTNNWCCAPSSFVRPPTKLYYHRSFDRPHARQAARGQNLLISG